jgi:hypothetical protein
VYYFFVASFKLAHFVQYGVFKASCTPTSSPPPPPPPHTNTTLYAVCELPSPFISVLLQYNVQLVVLLFASFVGVHRRKPHVVHHALCQGVFFVQLFSFLLAAAHVSLKNVSETNGGGLPRLTHPASRMRKKKQHFSLSHPSLFLFFSIVTLRARAKKKRERLTEARGVSLPPQLWLLFLFSRSFQSPNTLLPPSPLTHKKKKDIDVFP